jgi:hypothetical protein
LSQDTEEEEEEEAAARAEDEGRGRDIGEAEENGGEAGGRWRRMRGMRKATTDQS